MKINEPMISVVILTYNQEQTVGRTIESILAQKTDYIFEIIIGEDASPSDNTRSICEKFATQYPNIIQLAPKAANKGVVTNFDDCLKLCKGKYIAACAGDDWWHNETKLQKQVKFLEANSDYALCYSGAMWYNESTNESYYIEPQKPDNSNLLNQLLLGNFITAPSALYRRELLDKIDFNLFIELDFRMEDYPMWLEMSQYTKFHCIDQALISYTINQNSLSRFDDLNKQMCFENTVLRIKVYYWAKLKSTLELDKLLDAHYITLLFTIPKIKKSRCLILNIIKQIRTKTLKIKLMSLASSNSVLYAMMCKYYKIKG